jgi:hypothetical protein
MKSYTKVAGLNLPGAIYGEPVPSPENFLDFPQKQGIIVIDSQ